MPIKIAMKTLKWLLGLARVQIGLGLARVQCIAHLLVDDNEVLVVSIAHLIRTHRGQLMC